MYKSVHVDENHSIVINKNNFMLLYIHSEGRFYPFESKEDIPTEVADEYSVNNFNNAIKRFHQKDFDELLFDEETINYINNIKPKQRLHYTPSGKAMSFMLDKKVYEDFFNIFVNADNVSEKYYMSRSGRYENRLSLEFERGVPRDGADRGVDRRERLSVLHAQSARRCGEAGRQGRRRGVPEVRRREGHRTDSRARALHAQRRRRRAARPRIRRRGDGR